MRTVEVTGVHSLKFRLVHAGSLAVPLVEPTPFSPFVVEALRTGSKEADELSESEDTVTDEKAVYEFLPFAALEFAPDVEEP